MRTQRSGAIVNNSSIGGLIGLPGRAAYHASKHGVLGMTKSAALEYAARGIRINAVCPGTIETPMVAKMIAKEPEAMEEILRDQPIGRLGRPEEIANCRSMAVQSWSKLRHRARARSRWWLHGTLTRGSGRSTDPTQRVPSRPHASSAHLPSWTRLLICCLIQSEQETYVLVHWGLDAVAGKIAAG
jgi:NAD(P)-dependent dehydrogenase (short-subunit alcohol dehydrogenase family)